MKAQQKRKKIQQVFILCNTDGEYDVYIYIVRIRKNQNTMLGRHGILFLGCFQVFQKINLIRMLKCVFFQPLQFLASCLSKTQ